MSTTTTLPVWATPVAEEDQKPCECRSGLPVVATVPLPRHVHKVQQQPKRRPEGPVARCCEVCLIWERYTRAQISYQEAVQQIEALGGQVRGGSND